MASAKCFDYLGSISDPKKYQLMDDTILHDIRISDEPELEQARNLLTRFDSRKHYSFVAEKVLSK
jgi:hypothetical protein